MPRLHVLGIYALFVALLASLALPVSYPIAGWQGISSATRPAIGQTDQQSASLPLVRSLALEPTAVPEGDGTAQQPAAIRRDGVAGLFDSRQARVGPSLRHMTARHALMRLYALARLHLPDNAVLAN